MLMTRWVVAVCALAILLAGSLSNAQRQPSDKLASAKSVRCSFSKMATGSWSAANVMVETKSTTTQFGFDSINADEGTARVIGPFGPSDIVVRPLAGSLHFVQLFSNGPLYATTIFPQEMPDGKLKAVHTRHEYTEVSLPGFTSRPEQYYGECEIID